MQIENRNIDELIPYEFNNRTHGQEQVDRIANSISSFGFNQPIVVDENNIILVGHGRFLAAKKLGLKEVPTIKKLDLRDIDKKAYRIIDNKLQGDSTWDLENVELEFEALETAGFEFSVFGLEDLAKYFVQEETEEATDKTADAATFESKYAVLVTCQGENEQRRIFEKLTADGYDCKVVVS